MRWSGRVGARRFGLARGLRTVAVVGGFRLRAGWRKALSEKGKLAFGVVVCTILATNYAFSVRAMEEAPGRDVPVDVLFGAISFFALLTLFQWAPLGRWFNRQDGVKFGLTAGRRAVLTGGTNLVGLTMLLVFLNALLARVFAGSGWPRGTEWAFEGMDVVGAVLALVAAGPLGAVVIGGQGRKRWLGVVLGVLLLGVLGASAVEPLWAGEASWADGAVSGGRLAVLLFLMAGAFALEQRSPDDRGAKTKKRRGRAAVRRASGGRPAAAGGRAPAGIWSRPIFVVALAEARMMLRFRQVRLNLVLSWAMPLFMVFLLRSEELPDGGGQFALWTVAGIAGFLSVFWLAFFANLLGFTADGARRLSMSAENALAACMPGKVLGALGLVGSLVFVQTAVMSLVLVDRIPPADRAIPFLVAAFSLLGLAGGGTMVSIWLPRKPKLHEQRDFYCGVLAMVALLCWWLVHAAIFVGAVVAARLLGGPRLATVTMTVLLLFAAAACGALVVALAKGHWLRRRLREWAVTV